MTESRRSNSTPNIIVPKPNFGGNGQYLFWLDIQHQVLRRWDLNAGSETSLSLPASKSYNSGLYVPSTDKCIVFGTNNYAIIDPYTMTKDIDANYPDGNHAMRACTYDWVRDIIWVIDDINAQTKPWPYTSNMNEKVQAFSYQIQRGQFWPLFYPPSTLWGSQYNPGALNGKGLINFYEDIVKRTGTYIYDGTVGAHTQAYYSATIEMLFITGAASIFIFGTGSVTNSNINEGAVCYDPVNRYAVTCRGNGATNHVFSRFSIDSKTFVSNNSSKALSGSEVGCKHILWSPFTGKIYGRPDTGAVGRILVYDPAANSFDSDITLADTDNQVWNRRNTFWTNRLRVA